MEKLFVGGFPLEIQEIELAQLFSLYGEVSTIKIIRDRANKICKGYGFIEMATTEAAENAVKALDGSLLGERQLSVRIAAKEKPVISGSPASPAYKKPERNAEPNHKPRPKRPRLKSQ